MSIYNVLLGAAGSSAPFSISWAGFGGATFSNNASDTFSGVSIGTADPTRIVILVASGANNGGGTGGMTSVTCNGNAMTAQINLTTNRSPQSIWTLAVPTGTTATFVTTHFSGTCAIEIYVMYNSVNGGTATSTAAAYTAASFPSMVLTQPSNGGAIYQCYNQGPTIVGGLMSLNSVLDYRAFGISSSNFLMTGLYTPTTAGSSTNTASNYTPNLGAYVCASFV